jgi:hypothetical protein
MQIDNHRAYWLEIAGLTLGAILLFRFGLLGLVFLVPIQLVWIRRGEDAGLVASGGLLAGVILLKGFDLVRLRRALGPGGAISPMFLFIDVVFAAGLLAGLFAMNSERMAIATKAGSRRSLTVPERMLAALGGGVVVYGPAIAFIVAGDAVDDVIATQVELMRPLFDAAGAGTEEIRFLIQIVLAAILSGLLFAHFVMVVANWWIGVQIAFKSRFSLPAGNQVMARHSGYELTEFRLPVYLVWALIGAWGGVLLSMVRDLGWIAYVFWNAGFVMLALYAIQGIAIVWFYFDRRKIQRGTRIAVAAVMVIGLLIPGLRFIVGIGLPALGVSEIWIDYHRLRGSEEVT